MMNERIKNMILILFVVIEYIVVFIGVVATATNLDKKERKNNEDRLGKKTDK